MIVTQTRVVVVQVLASNQIQMYFLKEESRMTPMVLALNNCKNGDSYIDITKTQAEQILEIKHLILYISCMKCLS